MKKKLTRSDDKIIAGVCAGIAEYFGLDISLVRIGYILLSLLSVAFPGILAYIIMWIIIPDKQLTINNEQ
ncbi:MAG TPA: PspC domain-containing protein [Salinivirgaceae bacterium]|nr:PspC domain-containing protein [Salinivirgaceae bacterium]